MFVEKSQVLHHIFWGFVLCRLFFGFLGFPAMATLELVQLFRVDVYRPWPKKRKRKRSQTEKRVRWWMIHGSCNWHAFFDLIYWKSYESRGAGFGLLGNNEWWSQRFAWQCFQESVSKADSGRVRRGNQLMLKQSRHRRTCMNWRVLKCVENTRLAMMSTFQLDTQTLCFLNDGELAMNLFLLG